MFRVSQLKIESEPARAKMKRKRMKEEEENLTNIFFLHPAKPGKHCSNEPPLACLLATCSSSLGLVDVHRKVERQTWQMMERAAALSLRREPVGNWRRGRG